MTLDEMRQADAMKRKQAKAEKFEQLKMKAVMIVQPKDKPVEDSSPIVNINQIFGGLSKNTKGLKKKKLFTQSG